jgi:hypothetical protein
MSEKDLLTKEQQAAQADQAKAEAPGFIEKPTEENDMVDIKIAMVPGKTYNLTVKKGTTVGEAIAKAQKLHSGIKVNGKMAKIGKRAVDKGTKIQGGEIIMLVANVTGGRS